MRKIKFRAWFKEEKTMHHELLLNELHRPETGINQFLNELAPKAYVVMQFTGQTDQDDIEIYEGDVLERYNSLRSKDDPVQTIKSVVSWSDRYSRFEGMIGGKVIGNVYQNPDLLKE